ncbi:hypothetical protein [Leptodesmis sp.]|uniref:hypothetical protein n=1 Tax=Leptodesmis sp. TaxID=3100501 RepID=UPI004053510F
MYKITATPQPTQEDDEYKTYGLRETTIAQMQRTQPMIRICAIQTISTFHDLGLRRYRKQI